MFVTLGTNADGARASACPEAMAALCGDVTVDPMNNWSVFPEPLIVMFCVHH